MEPPDSLSVLDLLDAHHDELAGLLDTSLTQAWEQTQELLGNDPAQWRWGALHQTNFRHPLLDRFGKDLISKAAMKPFPRGGDGNSPNNTSFDGKDFAVTSGASWRMVLDVGNGTRRG